MEKRPLYSAYVNRRRAAESSFTQAIKIGERVIFSSIGGTLFEAGRIRTGKDFDEQIEIIIKHLKSILADAGGGLHDIVELFFVVRPGTTRTQLIEIGAAVAETFSGAIFAQRWLRSDFPGPPDELIQVSGEAVIGKTEG